MSKIVSPSVNLSPSLLTRPVPFVKARWRMRQVLSVARTNSALNVLSTGVQHVLTLVLYVRSGLIPLSTRMRKAKKLSTKYSIGIKWPLMLELYSYRLMTQWTIAMSVDLIVILT